MSTVIIQQRAAIRPETELAGGQRPDLVASPERRRISGYLIHEEIVPVGGAVALGPVIRLATTAVGSGGLYGQF